MRRQFVALTAIALGICITCLGLRATVRANRWLTTLWRSLGIVPHINRTPSGGLSISGRAEWPGCLGGSSSFGRTQPVPTWPASAQTGDIQDAV